MSQLSTTVENDPTLKQDIFRGFIWKVLNGMMGGFPMLPAATAPAAQATPTVDTSALRPITQYGQPINYMQPQGPIQTDVNGLIANAGRPVYFHNAAANPQPTGPTAGGHTATAINAINSPPPPPPPTPFLQQPGVQVGLQNLAQMAAATNPNSAGGRIAAVGANAMNSQLFAAQQKELIDKILKAVGNKEESSNFP